MTSSSPRDPDPARGNARRTALVLAAIALLIYGGFILSGVFAR